MTLANKEGHPTYKEAMVSPEAAGFVKAIETEILTLVELDVFEIVPHPNEKVISGVCPSSGKGTLSSVRKFKARYCARRFEQEKGIDYFETSSRCHVADCTPTSRHEYFNRYRNKAN